MRPCRCFSESAHASFPLRGYPQALVQAHEHARMGGLEIEMLESMLLQQVAERDPAVAHDRAATDAAGQAIGGRDAGK